ncbi:MAG: VPDSG-CTERM sorting domain-containing protein [Akkermansiaceae bacterium]|nr:VPDSG-CTERM sorting domain-containing protein [Akkermansiaceae bacterium]
MKPNQITNQVTTNLLSGAFAVAVTGTASAITYDAASDFSATNPSGAWTYGSYSTANTPASFVAFNNYAANSGGTGLDFHNISGDIDAVPAVFHNATSGTIFNAFTTLDVPAGGLALHPGNLGERAVIRFTVPTAGLYSISADFFGWDHGSVWEPYTTTDVYVNDASNFNFSGLVNGYSLTVPFASYAGGPAWLAAGSTIDFSVGMSGSSGDLTYFNDSTGLSAQVTSSASNNLPDGGTTVALLGLSLSGLAYFRRKLA